MDLRKLKTILELFEESNINELEISSGKETVRLSRGGHAPSPPITTVATKSDIAKMKESSSASPIAGNVVPSPMVGTFYRAHGARQAALCAGWRQGRSRTNNLYHRSHEADE